MKKVMALTKQLAFMFLMAGLLVSCNIQPKQHKKAEQSMLVMTQKTKSPIQDMAHRAQQQLLLKQVFKQAQVGVQGIVPIQGAKPDQYNRKIVPQKTSCKTIIWKATNLKPQRWNSLGSISALKLPQEFGCKTARDLHVQITIPPRTEGWHVTIVIGLKKGIADEEYTMIPGMNLQDKATVLSQHKHIKAGKVKQQWSIKIAQQLIQQHQKQVSCVTGICQYEMQVLIRPINGKPEAVTTLVKITTNN